MQLPPIDLEAYTPLDYWRTEAQYPPEGTGGRVHRFETYRDLSRGDLTDILPSWLRGANSDPVQTNYFHTVADLRAKFLLSQPPEAAGVDEDLMDEAIESTFEVIYDYTRYGTGLFHVYIGEDEAPHIQAIDPRYWFPARDGGEAIAVEHEDRYDVWLYLPEATILTRYERKNSDRRLGSVLDTQTFAPLAEGVIPIFNCAGRPRDGAWGFSIYPSIAPHVAEIATINSRISDIHQSQATPFYAIEGGDPESAADVTDKLAARTRTDVFDTDGTVHERREAAFRYQRLTGLVLPVDGKIVAVPTNADTADMREQAIALRNDLYVLSATPVNFLGNQDGMASGAVSGETIRRGNAYAETTLLQIQDDVSKCLEHALRLATGNDSISIEWENPFEELDRGQTPGVVAAEAMAEALGAEDE